MFAFMRPNYNEVLPAHLIVSSALGPNKARQFLMNRVHFLHWCASFRGHRVIHIG